MLRDYVGDREHEKIIKKKTKKLKTKNREKEARAERIRLKKFQQELKNKQVGKMKKRDAQQVKLCMRIYQLASNLEKKKLIDEKKQAKKERDERRKKKAIKMNNIENKFANEMDMINDTIQKEKFERKIAKYAQTQVRKKRF